MRVARRLRSVAARTALAVGAAIAVGAALALAGCGGGSSHDDHGRITAGGTVDIYSSLPLRGPAAPRAALVQRGIDLALSQAGDRAGPWVVKYLPLDDSTSAAGGWSALKTASNASRAIADPRAVLYLGELESGASRISIPILNQGALAQISPGSPYVGLTSGAPGSARGEPESFYPSGRRTFVRIVPSDAVQAGADLAALRQAACATTVEADDGGPAGSALSVQIQLARGALGVQLARVPTRRPAARARFTALLRRRRPDCLLLTGAPSPAAAQLAHTIRTVLPNVRMFASEAFCTGSFVTAIGPVAARSFVCLAPGPELGSSSLGRRLAADYEAAYDGLTPDPWVVYGYEAMRLGLETIATLGASGDSKQAVVTALRATAGRQSALGTYGFDADGDTTLRTYGLYRSGGGGGLTFLRTITAPAGQAGAAGQAAPAGQAGAAGQSSAARRAASSSG